MKTITTTTNAAKKIPTATHPAPEQPPKQKFSSGLHPVRQRGTMRAMSKKHFTIIGACTALAVCITAALAAETRQEQVLVKKLEQEIATGIGGYFPFRDKHITRSLGEVFLHDAQPAFSQAFWESLESIPWDEEHGASVSTISIRFDDATGVVYFYDSNGEIFFQEEPNKPFDPFWVNKLLGYELFSRPFNPYLLPSHVVGEYKLIATEDVAAYKSGLKMMKSQMKQPSVPKSSPVVVGDDIIHFITFTVGTNAFHFTIEFGDLIATAFNGDLPIEVVHFKDLASPLDGGFVVTNIPVPLVGGTMTFDVPFANVPGYVYSFQSPHDETCVTNTVETASYGTYTKTVYLCNHPRHQSDAGFFRLRIKDDGAPFNGIPRLWLARYSTPQCNLLAAFTADPNTAFANVYSDGNGGIGINAPGGRSGWYDTGFIFKEFYYNNWNPFDPPIPLELSDRLGITFDLSGHYTQWMMKAKGLGPTDTNTYLLENIFEYNNWYVRFRPMYFRKGNAYEISISWKKSNPMLYYKAYNWGLAILNNDLFHFPNPFSDNVQTYFNNNPVRRPGIIEYISGPGYIIKNTDGLLTCHVYMDDRPPYMGNPAGGPGNVAEGLKATLYVLLAEFVTPAGDPSKPDEMEDMDVDGKNQYTFSPDDTGSFEMHLRVLVHPPGAAEQLAKSQYCFFSVDKIGDSKRTWSPNNPGGKPEADGDYLTATVKFEGLPKNNSDFGWKNVRLVYGTKDLASTKFGIFFDKDAKNHPECKVTDCEDCPNWFYYWKEGGVCGIPNDCIYTNDLIFGQSNFIQKRIELGNKAPEKNDGPQIYTNSSSFVTITGNGEGKGIQCVAETMRHELEHFAIYDKFRNKFGVDSDGDWIFDMDEFTYGGISSDFQKRDTYELGTRYNNPDFGLYGDQEIRCFLRERDMDDKVKFYPEKDWANPGCQHKNQFGPQPQANP